MGSASPMVGTVPHDTSWEDWDQLRQDHHLENKMILQNGVHNIMNITRNEKIII